MFFLSRVNFFAVSSIMNVRVITVDRSCFADLFALFQSNKLTLLCHQSFSCSCLDGPNALLANVTIRLRWVPWIFYMSRTKQYAKYQTCKYSLTWHILKCVPISYSYLLTGFVESFHFYLRSDLFSYFSMFVHVKSYL